MKERIDFLIKMGLSEQQATDFVQNIANEAYSDGYSEGMKDRPAIVGESLGESCMDFYEWWDINVKKENKPLLFSELSLKMLVMDELGRIGKITLIEDIDNIEVAYINHKEYFSLRKDNSNGISKLYRA